MMLDNISTAIEQVVKTMRGAGASTKKGMTLDEFVSYALAQIQKAAKDKPELAKRRLSALKRSVDDVIAGVAKLSAEDTESENIDVEVVTVFAPTKADGDTPMDDLTTMGDQSSSETSLAGLATATGETAFAENLREVAKSLEMLKAELGAPAEGQPRARAKKADGAGGKAGTKAGNGSDRDSDGWPLDLSTDAFLKGAEAEDTGPTWGYDPDGVASPKAR
jgi:hypothetical protein